MAATEFALYIEDLSVSFDGFKAIDSLNLYIDKNELRVIIGPNGAGKTTLLDLICGKTRASSGSIKFKDEELTACPSTIVRRGIGRKFQTPSIYENLSVFENLEVSYPGRALGARRAVLQVQRRGAGACRWWLRRLAWLTSSTPRPVTPATGRSSGWRSACS